MLQMRCSHSYTLNKNVFSVSLKIQPNVWCSEFRRKTVPRTRSLDGETAVAVARPGAEYSQSTGISRPETSAGDSWRWLAVHLEVLWGHAVLTLVPPYIHAGADWLFKPAMMASYEHISLQSASGRFRFLVPPSKTTCLSTSHLRRHSRFSENDSRPFCFPIPTKTLSYDSCVTITIRHYCLDKCSPRNN